MISMSDNWLGYIPLYVPCVPSCFRISIRDTSTVACEQVSRGRQIKKEADLHTNGDYILAIEDAFLISYQ